MLIRANWLLTVNEPVLLPRAYGLGLVKDLHAKMNLQMGGSTMPNLTCSHLIGNAQSAADFIEFLPDTSYQLIMCGLNSVASSAIKDLDLTDTLALLGVKFQIERQADEVTSYEELYQRSIVLEPPAIDRYPLTFLSPTAFSHKGKYLPLPLPNLMFRSWLERWNHFAAVYLGGDELIEYLDRTIAIAQLRIHSRNIAIYQGNIPGFLGVVNLRLLATDPLVANVAQLLLAYSRFAGTGIKTRLGMGVMG
jgi:CRISPR-associated endoribonuclease Cas6